VRRINDRVDVLEEELRASLGNREVVELLKCQKGFVYFATALRATELLLERLQRSDLLHARQTTSARGRTGGDWQALDMTQTSLTSCRT
jgi:hypothetical protein